MKSIFLFYFYCFFKVLFSQNEEDNLIKYWNYKDKFNKYFTKIGDKSGHSIPAISIKYDIGQKVRIGGQMVLVKY